MTSTNFAQAADLATLPDRWRILIVDDHELYRTGLRDLLSRDADIEECIEAANVRQALELFRERKPNLVLIDVSLSDGDGIQLVERIKSAEPATAVLVISMFDENTFAGRAIAAGASGYVCKQVTNEELLDALRTVRRNRIQISASGVDRMTQLGSENKTAPAGMSEESLLSNRELEIFSLIGHGLVTHEIAQRLHLSPSTIETYRERIKTKLNLASGAALIRRAIIWLMQKS